MNITIVGTGVIGTLYGWALSKEHTVTHFVRKEKSESFQNKIIPYDIIDERLPESAQTVTGNYTYTVSDQISLDADLIIVPVNSFQLIDTLKDLKTQVPNGRFLIMTLNWNGTKEIDKFLAKEQYILGYAGGGGTFKDHLLWANIGEDLLMGAVYPEQKTLLTKAIKAFEKCGFKPEVPENVLHALWLHNIDSAPLGVGLTKYNDMSQLVQDASLVKICFGAMNECYTICQKRGVNLSQFPEVQMYSLPFDTLYPMFKTNFETNPMMQRYTAHAVTAIPEMVANFKEMYKTGKELSMLMPNMNYLNNLLTK